MEVRAARRAARAAADCRRRDGGASVQRRDQPHPNSISPGKLAELKDEIKRTDANVVASDDELSPRQERNLEQRSACRSSIARP